MGCGPRLSDLYLDEVPLIADGELLGEVAQCKAVACSAFCLGCAGDHCWIVCFPQDNLSVLAAGYYCKLVIMQSIANSTHA